MNVSVETDHRLIKLRYDCGRLLGRLVCTHRYLSAITPDLVDGGGLLHEYTSRRRISRTMQWCKQFC